ncbi:MAG: dockerin type I repeat-containing protein [Clostridia bacterium]|nr:dockerin type I repeat-containing protein [Clostridia bacterium]
MKKIVSLLILIIMISAVFLGTGIFAKGIKGDTNGDGATDNKDVVTLFRYVSGITSGAVAENCDFNNDKEINNKDVVALFRAVSADEITQYQSEPVTDGETDDGSVTDTDTETDTETTDTATEVPEGSSDVSESGTESEEETVTEEITTEEEMEAIEPGWNSTIAKANDLANGVQGRFTDAKRRKFLFENKNASILYDLSTNGKIGVTGIYNAEGKPYTENVSDVLITLDGGSSFSAAGSVVNGRMNSHRLGYYYYDFRFCNQVFTSAESAQQLTENEEYYDIIAKSTGWAPNDVSTVTKSGGVLSYTVTSSYDPYIVASGINFSAEKFDAVQITIKAESASGGNIYIAAGSHSNFSEDQDIAFRFNPGEWVTCIVPLNTAKDYTGNVTRFRLDVGSEAGELIQIKELKAIKRGNSSVPFQLERIFHTYSDKIHEVVRIVAVSEYSNGGSFSSQYIIPANNVNKLVLKNKNGEYSSLEGFDFTNTEYVGFDIKGAGVFGIIMPSLDSNGKLKVELKDGNYIITHEKEIKGTIKEKGDVYFGHRIYTSSAHSFDELKKEAYIERNPLKEVKISKRTDNAKYAGYDALAGFYRFTVNASNFNSAYYNEPNKHYRINTQIKGDGVEDRTIYVQSAESGGMLECAAMLDENSSMLPIPLEVGKNFNGEIEEPFYDPADTAYGEVYVPITVGKDETKNYTMLHLYQNWGNYPLKQLSFIAFHICYYHLSVGVTETNCIAPYFVYGKDGWTLPDFRANSAPLWSGQPQHTSAGRLYFLQYKDSDGNACKSESQYADIASAGPVYADINMEYLSDDGKIKATYRHAEMPQTDENRTYYNIRLEVLDDVKIKNFKNDFSFFTFDGRSVKYSKVGYLNKNNEMITESVVNGTRYIKLGKEYPYYDYYAGNEGNSVNFALIVLNSDITVGGSKYDGGFIFRDSYDGSLNYGSLSLDLGAVTLKKGDVLEMQIILLPWGYSTSTNDSNVRSVRNDSCFDPYKLTPVKGTAVEDCFIPSIKAVNNEAVFKISGGKNNAAVRVYGFKDYTAPAVTAKADGKSIDFNLSNSSHGYDGYQVYKDADGTYSFSFVIDMDKADEYEITVKQ